MDDDQVRELEALEGILSDPNAEPIRLSYGLLKFITDNFSHEIGRGGFGVVYQGDLQNGVVAVKRSNGLYITDKQFMDEIKCLKSANHKNIVRFLGYCADTQEEVMPLDGTFVMAGERNRLFCFEYVPNGNIRQYLEQDKSHVDDWPARYQMIRGICQGLKYLHDKKINHRDLKPENVMLDADMEAKITDFGLSRFLCQGQSQIITQHICGTLRYIAPEVIDRRELSLGSDIYALGVIIIELLTGTSMISLENVTVAVYVFWKSWPGGDTNLLIAAILLFILGIFKCFEKPWALNRASINNLVSSSQPIQRSVYTPKLKIDPIDDFIKKATSPAGENGYLPTPDTPVDFTPYKLFVDLASPSPDDRIRMLQSFSALNDNAAYCKLQRWLSQMFQLLYTKEKILPNLFFEEMEASC